MHFTELRSVPMDPNFDGDGDDLTATVDVLSVSPGRCVRYSFPIQSECPLCALQAFAEVRAAGTVRRQLSQRLTGVGNGSRVEEQESHVEVQYFHERRLEELQPPVVSQSSQQEGQGGFATSILNDFKVLPPEATDSPEAIVSTPMPTPTLPPALRPQLQGSQQNVVTEGGGAQNVSSANSFSKATLWAAVACVTVPLWIADHAH